MGSDAEDSQANPLQQKSSGQETGTLEDEIDLMDYFRVLWRRKYLTLLGSILPASIVGLLLVSLPTEYRVRYIYALAPIEADYNMLVDTFYSAENFGRIRTKLREHGIREYAGKICKTKVELGASPLHSPTTIEKDKKKSKDAPETVPTLVTLSITGGPEGDMQKIGRVIRENLEKVVPMHLVRFQLKNAIAGFKAGMAEMEESRFELGLDLESKRAVLAKLRTAESGSSNKTAGGIILQVTDLKKNTEYLPLAYQIEVTQSNIITLEETIKANQRRYGYYAALVNLNEKLLQHLQNKMRSYYTIEEFHSFITGLADDDRDPNATGYVRAYLKRIENMISTTAPYSERSAATPVAKGTARKVAVVFAVSLMISILAAFLLEGIQKSRAKAV
ncbi:MAG: hypothetical protein ACYTEQ_07305 [Planctomycetota bacterium]|jgi:hypothetical protein